MKFTDQLNRFIEPIRNKIRMVIQRALLSAVDDSTELQLIRVSVLKDEVFSGVERVQNYGLTSVPPSDSEVVLVNLNGNRDQAIAIAVDNATSRKKDLSSGEVALYDKNGSYILLKANGDIEVRADGKVSIDGDTIELGTASLEKLVKGAAFTTLFNAHTHTVGALPSVPPAVIPTLPPVVPMTAAQLTIKTEAE